ncbi:ADP-ribose pyrophosphatase [Haladaptatus litoreus]|uniref:ADP-ribose pyrophosphatase n=1 Tax=Haladaptatus litoreus TaxID=553468 RepID=A0A1N6ZVC4_9EURY|nr:NUDIX hydrolase [Haladaptatus litoreus]SIR30783.1 ADP-ribose pyrophosphatase [Haladaptatus litoreus]
MAEDDPLAWETLDSEVAYACPGFDIRHEDVRLPDGTKTDFDYLSESESVVVLPFTEGGDVVVIEEWRQAVSRVSRGLPVGGVEPEDESLEASAHRELTEETGYEADRVSHLTTVEPANGIADSVLHYFVARDCVPSGKQELDHNESIRPSTTTFDALKEKIQSDSVYDGRTVLGILYYEAFSDRAFSE